jgi:hypothetical protein
MKRTDVAMIIFIASISMLLSYFVAKTVLGDIQNEAVTVKTVDAISKDVKEPDTKIFNQDAVNPTVEVFIGSEGERSS